MDNNEGKPINNIVIFLIGLVVFIALIMSPKFVYDIPSFIVYVIALALMGFAVAFIGGQIYALGLLVVGVYKALRNK